MRKIVTISLLFLFLLSNVANSQNGNSISDNQIAKLRDSLDAIQMTIPQIPKVNGWKVIYVKNQAQWEAMPKTIAEELKNGARNIEVRVTGKGLVLPVKSNSIASLNYPEANVRIVAKGVRMTPEGVELYRSQSRKVVEDGLTFWMALYKECDLDIMITDQKGNEIPIREEANQVAGEIVMDKEGIWKFEINLPNLSEDDCKDFYVLMTRDWTSARHKVVKVKDGWLYYQLDSEDLHSDRNPNVDWTQYKVRPRYRLINCPVSKGVHIKEGKIYVPWEYKKIRISKGGFLVHVGGCRLNSLEITGFKLNGLGRCPIGVYHSVFTTGMFVHHNTFSNLSNLAINAAWNENVIFSDNTVTNTRVGVTECGGKNNTIARNRLKNIGWMLNTRAIIGGGDGLHICDNVIEDFNVTVR